MVLIRKKFFHVTFHVDRKGLSVERCIIIIIIIIIIIFIIIIMYTFRICKWKKNRCN